MFTSECRWQGEPLPKCYCLAECRMSDGRQLHPEKSIAMADWFALAGWYLSEGSSWITPRNYTVSIVQAPGAKQKEIVSLLERMDFTPYVNGRNITVSNKQLYTALQQLGQGAATKRIPRWMLMAPRALLERLRNALMLGDGDATGRRYSTVSRGLADDVMELMLKLGRHAWVGEEMRTVGQTVLPIFRVHLSTRPQMVTKRQHRSIIPYTGTVYDVTLDKNHVMMVRRKGRPVWSGNCGTWDGGREKAPAAICRKVIEAKDTGSRDITIWGDGHQTRSFMYIDDCTQGIDMIMHCDRLIATPINLGSNFLISVNDLVSLAEEIGGVKLNRHYDLNAPKGVGGRNSDNTFIQQILGWEPGTPLKDGLRQTYAWIERQYQDRKAGKRTVS